MFPNKFMNSVQVHIKSIIYQVIQKMNIDQHISYFSTTGLLHAHVACIAHTCKLYMCMHLKFNQVKCCIKLRPLVGCLCCARKHHLSEAHQSSPNTFMDKHENKLKLMKQPLSWVSSISSVPHACAHVTYRSHFRWIHGLNYNHCLLPCSIYCLWQCLLSIPVCMIHQASGMDLWVELTG